MSYLEALDTLVESRPHLEPGNYGDLASYRADQRGNMQARNDYRAIRACVAPDDATLAELARGSRLSFETADDGTIVADYCAGQYYPIEYRRACVRLIASAWWQAQAGRLAEADAQYIRTVAKAVFGPGIARRWFN